MKKLVILLITVILALQTVNAQIFETPSEYIVSTELPFDFSEYGSYVPSELFYWTGKEWMVGCKKTLDFITWENFPYQEQFGYDIYLLLWDGENYLAYPRTLNKGFQSGQMRPRPVDESTIYKITPDGKTILESYTVPGSIFEISYANGIYYAQCSIGSFSNKSVYYSTDLINWEFYDEETYIMENPDVINSRIIGAVTPEVPISIGEASPLAISYRASGSRGSGYTKDVKSNISVLSADGENAVIYERILPKIIDVDGTYFFTSSEHESITTIEFSKDGIYWAGFEMPENIGDIQRVYAVGDRLIVQSGLISGRITYVSFNKQEVYGMIENSLANQTVYVKLDNKILGFDIQPIMENDRMLVPMRFLFEQMGEEVTWENNTQTATVQGESNVISFSIDNSMAKVNGVNQSMDAPARLIDDKTLIPLRFLSENLGYNVEWNAETNTAVITTK